MKQVWNDLSTVASFSEFKCNLPTMRVGNPQEFRAEAVFVIGAFAQQLCSLFGQVER